MRIFAIMILAAAIAAFPTAAAPRADETLRVELGKEAPADKGKIKVRFLEVLEDSRCPVDATCVWAGNAKIKLAVYKGKSDKPVILELNTTVEPRTASCHGYTFVLEELQPQKGDNRPAPVTAVLKVKRT